MKKDLWIIIGFGFELILFLSSGYFLDRNPILAVLLLLAGLVAAYLVGKLIGLTEN